MIWMCVGIYIGFVVVGNVGVFDCWNYMVVGDIVNVVECL